MSKLVLTFLLACCSVTSVFASPYLQYVPPPDFSAANQLYASGSQQMQQGIQQLGNGLVRVAEAAERRKQQQQQMQTATTNTAATTTTTTTTTNHNNYTYVLPNSCTPSKE